ncbi:MAG: NAD(P)/FAD-dependent oxidoreductase [Chloroflexi bacterium]|nr:NAD(P)/FAD-dependent oxidoreductase [Chloroflexota bacterium]MCI0580146.1 NAD(P)/FAD-dependent oxidoreductase [Chloroflexota bacterium]MCI0646618.1 NAD(P)/FAD-dependent oxidoreductase [Chloroflexota bacterium]MCI0730220.1 NAD(P)/FAD-dependent oxidoreductase [Chloroflexota bacterium]
MPDYDAIIVGAGHNGLICAGYLARAGYKVCVLERRHVVGGAVATEEIVPGYQFDIGGSALSLIHLTSIIEELNLAAYGFEPIPLEPCMFAPFPDGSHLFIWKDLAQTCHSIATISPADADRYYQFVQDYLPFTQTMIELMGQVPRPLNLGRSLWRKVLPHFWHHPRRLGQLRLGLIPFLRQTFASPQLQALIGWMAAQGGVSPFEAGSAFHAAWFATYHLTGFTRPRGGAGQLTQALAKMIQAHGGQVMTRAPVERILVQAGQAVGVILADGSELSAHQVISGTHIFTTARLLGTALSARWQRKIQRSETGNGLGVSVRLAMDALPDYLARPGSSGPQHKAIQLVCPTLDILAQGWHQFERGLPATEPALVAMTFSAVDQTLAPPGQHVLYLWGQYFPYTLANGRSWSNYEAEAADLLLQTLARYAPNVSEAVVARFIESPEYFERELDLVRGNIAHITMSARQLFMFRPALGLGQYRTPIKNMYITGASTHPGGGIWGQAGANAATVVLADRERFQP